MLQRGRCPEIERIPAGAPAPSLALTFLFGYESESKLVKSYEFLITTPNIDDPFRMHKTKTPQIYSEEVMSLRIEEIMIKDVVKIDGSVTAEEVAAIMDERGIGCVVVVQNENPIGIITERDLLKRVLLGSRNPKTTKAYQIMTAPLLFGNPRKSIRDAVKLMSERKIRKLPIVDNEERLVGMITLTDLARSVAFLEHICSKAENDSK